MNQQRVEWSWQRKGLTVPPYPKHDWAYDFVAMRTEDGRQVTLLTSMDEYMRECLRVRSPEAVLG